VIVTAPQSASPGNARLLNIAEEPAPRRRSTPGASRIRDRDLPVFTRALAAMLSSGLPVMDALHALAEQTDSATFRSVVMDVWNTVREGHSLSAAIARHPAVFSQMYVSLLRTGEASGKMSETLEDLADHIEAAAELKARLRAAMIYPIAIAIIAFSVTCFMLLVVIPSFERIYADLGGTLPAPTRVLISVSRAVRVYGIYTAAVVTIALFLFSMLRRTKAWTMAWDRFLLTVPVVGSLALKVCLCRLTRTLAGMLHSGVPILNALQLAAPTTGNSVMIRALLEARTEVESGHMLSDSLRDPKLFPRLLTRMLSAGERSGKTDEMLTKVAEYYEREVDLALKSLSSTIEPILIVALGLVIGGLMLGLFMPIFKLHEIVSMSR